MPTPEQQVAELRRVLAVVEKNAESIISYARLMLDQARRGR